MKDNRIDQNCILYTFAIMDGEGNYVVTPVLAWRSAEHARRAAASYIADRAVSMSEADDLCEWREMEYSGRDGRLPTLAASTKRGREVRVWPIELIEEEPPTP